MLSLENILPLFTNLQGLALTRLVSLDCPGRMSDLDQEFEYVVKWGGLCPALRTCSLPCKFFLITHTRTRTNYDTQV